VPAFSSTFSVKPFLTNVETTVGVRATRFSFRNVSLGTPIESDLYGAPAMIFFPGAAASVATCWANSVVVGVGVDDVGRRHIQDILFKRLVLNKMC